MKKMLVADDEQVVRSVLKKALGETYTIVEAVDGVEAVEIAHKEMPALVLMDVMMPRIDGYTACFRIKSDPETKDIMVVMVTALGQELNKKLGEQMGADGYVVKPFHPEQIRFDVATFLKNAGKV